MERCRQTQRPMLLSWSLDTRLLLWGNEYGLVLQYVTWHSTKDMTHVPMKKISLQVDNTYVTQNAKGLLKEWMAFEMCTIVLESR